MMKKYLNLALGFAIYGLCCGVYFREFTKFNNYTAKTMLGNAHPHVLMLGAAGFLLIALFVKVLGIGGSKRMKWANILYIAGIIIASVMMIVRGTMEVAGQSIAAGTSGAISGIAGIGHIAVAIGMILYIIEFKKHA